MKKLDTILIIGSLLLLLCAVSAASAQSLFPLLNGTATAEPTEVPHAHIER